MASKNQEMVWSEVRKAQAGMAESLFQPAAAEVRDISSYATGDAKTTRFAKKWIRLRLRWRKSIGA